MSGLKFNKWEKIYALEVVGRGSDAKLQEGANLKLLNSAVQCSASVTDGE